MEKVIQDFNSTVILLPVRFISTVIGNADTHCLSFEPWYRFRYQEYGRIRKNVNTRNVQSVDEPKVVKSIVEQIIYTILGMLGIFVLSVAGFYIFRGLSPICEDEECLDIDCSDSCNHCKNYKRISIDNKGHFNTGDATRGSMLSPPLFQISKFPDFQIAKLSKF